jgi:hypothetical protein
MSGDEYNRQSNGQFGNGNKGGAGRGPTGGLLSTQLKRAASKVIELPDGTRIGSKRFVARQVWNGLTHGAIVFADGSERRLNAAQWMDLFEMVRDSIGEKPRQEVSGPDGEAILIRMDM